MFNAPLYSKVVIEFQRNGTVEFTDAGLIISGSHMIVVQDTHDSMTNTQKSEGKIFELSQVKSYTTYKS